MRLLVGLGNPGPRYARNRHNIGFMALDRFAERHGASPWKQKFQGEASEVRLGGERVMLLKPMTYMNESGRAVGAAARFLKIAPGDVFVLHDELDLAPGKIRVKTGGGAAGHNGLRSTDAHLGNAYHRIRLGIGHPGHAAQVHGHVLSDFAKSDQVWLDPVLDAVADHLPALLTGDQPGFMNKVSLAVRSATADQASDQP